MTVYWQEFDNVMRMGYNSINCDILYCIVS